MASHNENSEQKKRWKAEKEQLQADLAARQKVVKKREVPLKFGAQFQSKKPSPPNKTLLPKDDFLRRQLGL